MGHMICCEICKTHTKSGVIVQDKGWGIRMFCFYKCLYYKLDEQERKRKRKNTFWDRFFFRTRE